MVHGPCLRMCPTQKNKAVTIVDPTLTSSGYCGCKFIEHNPGVNIGIEYVNMSRNVYDLSTVLPDIAMIESRWTIFLQAIIYIMPEDAIDD
eukprot:6191194-Karenia_brevis.AAC.1